MSSARDLALERARRAYAVARVAAAMRSLLVGMTMMSVSVIANGPTSPTTIAGLVLAVILGVARWRGGVAEAACRVGLAIGLPALVAPVIASDCGGAFGVAYATTCFVLGCAVGLYSMTCPIGGTPSTAIAAVVAAITGSLGCAAIGFGTAAGLVVGSVAARTFERLASLD